MSLSDLEATLGFVFQDKSLLQRALTHRSYLNENPEVPWLDNERLEFLGDSILGFVTAEHLYHRFPEMKEGDLTSLRAALVRGQTLAEFATQLNLGPHLMISRGEEAGRGRTRPALLAATLEAIIGALYLDQGLDAARSLIVRMIDEKTQGILQERLDRNAKSLLQELSQGRLKVTPVYRLVETRGPDHAREFTVEAVLGDRVYGVGRGRNKQAAEQEAARAGIAQLESEFEIAAVAEAQAALDALTAQPTSSDDSESVTPAENSTPE
ncbi:MAG TPA: ribonuclease III [Anaerolineae bacterium]|nr:ribonuclease III [Anaerolineae bacterium]